MEKLGSRRKPGKVSTRCKCFLNTKNPLGPNRISKTPAICSCSHRTLRWSKTLPSSSHGFALLLKQKSPNKSPLILNGVKQELAGGWGLEESVRRQNGHTHSIPCSDRYRRALPDRSSLPRTPRCKATAPRSVVKIATFHHKGIFSLER